MVVHGQTKGTSRADVSRAISEFSPRLAGSEAAEFSRQVVARCQPENPRRARDLLFATSRLVSYALEIGLEVRTEVVLCPQVIERFIVCGTGGFSHATTRTLRSNLRFVARRLGLEATPVAISRERAKPHYLEAEIAAYLALADAQPTIARRMRMNGLICLGAGAGLVGADLRSVRGSHIKERSGGLLTEVFGKTKRAVPVLTRYHGRLKAAAAFAGDDYVIGGEDPDRKNLTNKLVSSNSGGIHLGRIDTRRLRSTWLRECAAEIGLRTFMAAAAISCSQRLGDIVASLDPASEEEAVSLLRATT